MKIYEWDEDKNVKLKFERGVSFDTVLIALESGKLLATIVHPNKKRYPEQRIYVVEIDSYAYMIPFVETEDKCFLKTIIPSRKMTKHFLIERRKS